MKEETEKKTAMEIIDEEFPTLIGLCLDAIGSDEIFFNDETGYPVYKAGDNRLNVYGIKMVSGELWCYTCEYPEYADNKDCWTRLSDMEEISLTDIAECLSVYIENLDKLKYKDLTDYDDF